MITKSYLIDDKIKIHVSHKEAIENYKKTPAQIIRTGGEQHI
jgi:hypothetical protein